MSESYAGNFAASVALLRAKRGMSQVELAMKSGLIHQTVVSKIEAREREVNLDEAMNISRALETPLIHMCLMEIDRPTRVMRSGSGCYGPGEEIQVDTTLIYDNYGNLLDRIDDGRANS